jgi:hypothetical protein
MIKKFLLATVASIILISTAVAGPNDAASFNGSTCLYRATINNGTPVATYQFAIFYWYANTVKTTGTVVQSYPTQGSSVPNLFVEHFKKSDGTMHLHFYAQDPTGTRYLNLYSANQLDYSGNPAYTLIYGDASSGNVIMDINGSYSGLDGSSFVLGTPFQIPTNDLPWTTGCKLVNGLPANFYTGTLNQLYVDQDNDDYDTLSTPRANFQGFVMQTVQGDIRPLPLGYQGTGVFGLNHGAPLMRLEGDAALFPQNVLGNSFSVLTGTLGTTFNFPWHDYQ